MIRKLQDKYVELRKQVRQKIRPQLTRLNTLEQRERIVITVLLVTVLGAIANFLIIDPNNKRSAEFKVKMVSADKTIKMLSDEAQQIKRNRDFDPDKEIKQERERINGRIARLDAQLEEFTVDLISPSEMARLLDDMLGEETGLVLNSLETLPAEPVVKQTTLKKTKEGDRAVTSDRMFRHGIVMVFHGDYFSALHYLTLLEGLPWDFFWDQLTYDVTDYPDATITLRIHTLSSQAGGLGV